MFDNQNDFERIMMYNTRYDDLYYDFPIYEVTFLFIYLKYISIVYFIQKRTFKINSLSIFIFVYVYSFIHTVISFIKLK